MLYRRDDDDDDDLEKLPDDIRFLYSDVDIQVCFLLILIRSLRRRCR